MNANFFKAAMKATGAATIALTMLTAQPAFADHGQPVDSSDTINFQVSQYAVGPIYLGMTVGEAKANAPGLTFERGAGPENSIVVDVKQGGKLLMSLSTMEEIEYNDAGNAPPIDDSAIIAGIEVLDPRFKTFDGVHIGMDVAKAERSLGKLKKMFNYPHGGETPTFFRQPDSLSFTIAMPEGSDSYTAGIYKPVENCNEFNPPLCEVATSYNTGAQISGMWVGFGYNSQRQVTEITGLPEGYRILRKGPTAESCESGSPYARYDVWFDYPNSGYNASVETEAYLDCEQEFAPFERIDHKEQNFVMLRDLNFDSVLDLAIYRGNIGGYGSAAYDIYLYDEPSGSYSKHEELSELTMSLGMFEVNTDEQSYMVYGKSGCCYHVATKYKFEMEEAELDAMPNLGPLKKVYEKTVESTSETEGTVTERVLVDGEWIERKRPRRPED